MSAADLRTPVLSSPLRRKLVHGGLIAVAVLYVGALVLAPLIGIAWAAINAGWDAWKATLTDPDAIHAYYLTAGITVVTVVVTGIFGVIVAMVLARDHFSGQEHRERGREPAVRGVADHRRPDGGPAVRARGAGSSHGSRRTASRSCSPSPRW